MRIALLTSLNLLHSDETDLAKALATNISQHLAQAGHHVELFAPQFTTNINEVINSNSLGERVQLITLPVYKQLPVDELWSEHDFSLRKHISAAFNKYLPRDQLDNYQLIISFFTDPIRDLLRSEKLPITRTVLFPIKLSTWYAPYYQPSSLYQEREKKVIEQLKHFVVCSDSEAVRIQQEHSVSPKYITVMPPGYEPALESYLRDKLPHKDITIICSNLLRPSKGQQDFIPLLRHARDQGMNLKLILTGSTSLTDIPAYDEYIVSFFTNVRQYDLAEQIVTTGLVAPYTLSQLFRQADVAIFPYQDELFGRAALESMVSGLPTITYNDIQSCSPFLKHGETGWLVDRNTLSLYEGIKELQLNPERYTYLSANGISAGKQYSWGYMCKRLLQYYYDNIT